MRKQKRAKKDGSWGRRDEFHDRIVYSSIGTYDRICNFHATVYKVQKDMDPPTLRTHIRWSYGDYLHVDLEGEFIPKSDEDCLNQFTLKEILDVFKHKEGLDNKYGREEKAREIRSVLGIFIKDED